MLGNLKHNQTPRTSFNISSKDFVVYVSPHVIRSLNVYLNIAPVLFILQNVQYEFV